MSSVYEIKAEYLGPKGEGKCKEEVRVLNRTIRWKKEGLEYEPDQRHAELMAREMGVESSKGAPTPMVAAKCSVEARENSPDLQGHEASNYRGLVARGNYLAQDRPDISFATKAVAKHMAKPKACDWTAVKRLARYLAQHGRLVQTFPWQSLPSTVTAVTDSDWAGDAIDRKSTSGGLLLFGTHVLKSWSSTQQVTAMSSGEAELYALIKGAAQAKGMISFLSDYGFKCSGLVRTDSSAALGIVHRRGLGRTRHIECQYL